ncbi:MAG: hypothetical protein KBH78_02635 [Candidatus Hydrogenedentes bacterium]|nr:hypothetical protein [Candidatus Hydrogenedentota bacterium]
MDDGRALPAETEASPAERVMAATRAGAMETRRSRRTFRFLVGAVVLTTVALWFADQYLRLPRLETMFRMTRTLPAPSARAVLRNVARQDARLNTTPNPRYLEALGDVEEPDLAPSVYDQAFRLDSRNALLAIKSGCALFHLGRFLEARDRFREAAALSPPNVLPRYLEAAALCASLSEHDDPGDVLAVLARANTSDAPVILPAPLWHPTLPEGGAWQARVARDMSQWVLTPLYVMADILRERARGDILSRHGGPWREWSELVEATGARMIRGGLPDRLPDLEQILAGLNLVRTAREIRGELSPDGAGNATSGDTLSRAMDEVSTRAADFFNSWESRVADYDRAARQPILRAVTVLVVFGVSRLLVELLVRLFGQQWRVAKTLPVSFSQVLAPVMTGLLFTILLLMTLAGWPRTLRSMDVSLGWWYLCGALPMGISVAVSVYLAARPSPGAWPGQAARFRDRVSFGLGVLRRQLGTMNGVAIVVFCCWLLLFRMTWNAYPFQFSLVTPGLTAEEMELARKLRELLLTAMGGP